MMVTTAPGAGQTPASSVSGAGSTQRGAALGVEAPVNRTLHALVKLRDAKSEAG